VAISKDFRERELGLIFDAAEAIPQLAYARTEEDGQKAVSRFRTLYSGTLVLIETQRVCTAMARLGAELRKTRFADRGRLSRQVLQVSTSLRAQLKQLQDTGYSTGLETVIRKKDDDIGCLT
jgi:hypothetical protein